jgi:ubiquinone/menaquinone biosynthesis C-methylase UbiE
MALVNTSSATPTSAAHFDTMMSRLERHYFPDARHWVCSRAAGHTLEVAIGTGLNLPHYPAGVQLTGVDLNPAMLEFAASRAHQSGRTLHTQVADALALPFDDGSFDSVVCTFALCEVPDVGAALGEFARVLHPEGSLLLADHVIATSRAVRLGQRLLQAVTIPLSGEHFTRRPSEQLPGAGLETVETLRRTHGAVEYVKARKRRRH